jgi:hypothetical protein
MFKPISLLLTGLLAVGPLLAQTEPNKSPATKEADKPPTVKEPAKKPAEQSPPPAPGQPGHSTERFDRCFCQTAGR